MRPLEWFRNPLLPEAFSASGDPTEKERAMLYWAMVFLIIALVAGALGMFNVAAGATNIAWILFVVFMVLFLVSLIAGGVRRPIP